MLDDPELPQFPRRPARQRPARLADSLRAYTGHSSYRLEKLRSDLDRFAFPLGGNDSEQFFETGQQ